jgi:hypothetical protein
VGSVPAEEGPPCGRAAEEQGDERSAAAPPVPERWRGRLLEVELTEVPLRRVTQNLS